MTEINNIQNYKYNSGKVENKKEKGSSEDSKVKNETTRECEVLRDTGVLGRSQVTGPKGGDIAKSIDEALLIVGKHADILDEAEYILNQTYKDFVEQGMDETKAYMSAIAARDHFIEIAGARPCAE